MLFFEIISKGSITHGKVKQISQHLKIY